MQVFHCALTFRKRTGCLFNHRIQWQFVDLIQRFHQSLLDLRQAAANSRDNLITIKFTNTGYCRRIWIEIKINIQCTSDQVSGFQRSA
ncbi:Uncharacterised protein [Shigella sonnei]|nr:Uncharacterised protein [Shigella sonnei]